jgi:hypothetical protein
MTVSVNTTAGDLPEGDLDWPVNSVDERGVTELRVHGVGGTPPESMLGDPHPRQVSGDRLAGMWRGADAPIDGEPRWHREAYSWGGLTSKAFVSALWLVLLPFALLNLAGWTAVGRRPAPGSADRPSRPDWRIGYQHSLVRIIGLAATWTYVLFGGLIAMDFGGWQCSRAATSCRVDQGWEWLGLAGHPARASVVAAIVPVAVVAVLAVLSQETTRRYERYAAPGDEPDLPLDRIELTDRELWLGGGYAYRERNVHIASSLLVPAALLLFVADDGGRFPVATSAGLIVVGGLVALSVLAAGVNPVRKRVFDRFWVSVLVGLAVLGFAGTLAWLQPARELENPALMPGTLSTFNALIVGVYTAALLLGVIALAASRRAGRDGWVGMTFGLPGPYVAVVLSVLLMFAVWAGVAVWAARLMSDQAEAWPAGGSDDAIVYPGTFGWLAFIAVGLLLVLLFTVGVAALVAGWWVRRRAWPDLSWERGLWTSHRLAEARRVSGTERKPSAWLRTMRWRQWLAGITRWIEVALVIAVLLATVSAIGYSAVFTWRWFGWGLAGAVAGLLALGLGLTMLVRSVVEWRRPIVGVAAATAAVAVVAGVAWWLSGMDDAVRPATAPLPEIGDLPVEGFTATVLTLIPVASVLLMRQAIANPRFRRTVGVAWDVATFWPRAFHPLAPPSYAERAVPELTIRIRGLLRRGNAVLLAGHSQGAVLTVAAAAQLTDLPDEQGGRFSVVTYGNPVVNLYQRWFPTYVNRRLIDRVTGLPGRWVNFFRYTDPIGRELFAGHRRDEATPPPTTVPDPRGDCWLPDPPTDLRRPGDGDPVVRGHGHYGYLRQSAFHGHLVAEARRLGADGGSGDAGGAELDADPGPDRPRGLGNGVLPGALAGPAHDDQVAVPERES